MAVLTTKAIVLSALKYSESSLIVKCYTEKLGIKTYLIRGVLKNKKGLVDVVENKFVILLINSIKVKLSLNAAKVVAVS